MTTKIVTWEGASETELERLWNRSSVHLFSLVDSTNTRARELAEAGAPAGTIVIADEQSAGRGLAARRWHSPRGEGLYLSMLLRPRAVANPLLLPLLAGLATARAVASLLPSLPVGVKWPNDLIVRDRKAGGVLAESSWAGGAPSYVVIGIGINVHQQANGFPDPLRKAAVSLDVATGRRVSRLQLAGRLLSEVEATCLPPPAKLNDQLLGELNGLDWLRDRGCRVVFPDGEAFEGVGKGLAADGCLLVRNAEGSLRRVYSGRVAAEGLVTPDY